MEENLRNVETALEEEIRMREEIAAAAVGAMQTKLIAPVQRGFNRIGLFEELGRRYEAGANDTARSIVERAAAADDPVAIALTPYMLVEIDDSREQERAVEACRAALASQAWKGHDTRRACAAGRSLGDLELEELEVCRQKALQIGNTFEEALIRRLQAAVGDPAWSGFWAEQSRFFSVPSDVSH